MPAELRFETAGADHCAELRFPLPADMLPHQYQIKVLAASPRDLAFAQTPFMVTPPRPFATGGRRVKVAG